MSLTLNDLSDCNTTYYYNNSQKNYRMWPPDIEQYTVPGRQRKVKTDIGHQDVNKPLALV